MNRLVILIIILLGSVPGSNAQTLRPSTYNFGKVELWNNPPAVFRFTNTTNKPGVFLPIPYQHNLQIELPKGYIAPGQEVEIKAIYFTSEGGNLNIQQAIYFSSSPDPIFIRLKGRIASIHPDAITECPTVDKKPAELRMEKGMASVTVFDAKSGLVISGVDLLLEGNGRRFLMENTRRKMIALDGLPIGFYGVKVSKNGYEELNSALYLNKNTGAISYMLNPLPDVGKDPVIASNAPPQEDFTELELTPEDDMAAIERIRKLMDEKYKGKDIRERDVLVIRERSDSTEQVGTSTVNVPAEPPAVKDTTEEVPDLDAGGQLNREKYALNNVVFLIDVSGSMKIDNKLDKLKVAMKELVYVLRPEDRLTIITYSSRSEVVLASCPGDQKDRIFGVIDQLIAKGNSFGAEGMDMAYKNARRNFINKGNNQIILASDGLFNSREVSNKDLYDMAAAQKEMGIGLSVVGFGKKTEAREFMVELASHGGGSYMEINSMDEINYVLLREIMKNARKG